MSGEQSSTGERHGMQKTEGVGTKQRVRDWAVGNASGRRKAPGLETASSTWDSRAVNATKAAESGRLSLSLGLVSIE